MGENVNNDNQGNMRAYFAGGCFWCTEQDLKSINGVIGVIPGYSGGTDDNPTYEKVCSGTSGHRETVKIIYNPEVISYGELIDRFLRTIDPFDSGGQFFDRGPQYSPAIFYLNESERLSALKCIESAAKKLDNGKPAVDVIEFRSFHKAEDYHHNFAVTNSFRYYSYRRGSGRDEKLDKIWNREK